MEKVLIAAPISTRFKNFLQSNFYELIYIDDVHSYVLENIIGIITSNKLHLNEETLRKYSSLKWIGRLGSGMEIIDTAYCDKHHIAYFSSPQGIANAVAEHSVGMLLSLLHNIHRAFQEIKQRQWMREENRGIELARLTVGIIGYGHTGSAFAKKLKAFTPHILAYDKYKSGFSDEIIQEVSLQKLMQEADVLSFHVPLNEETKHYYDETFMNQMAKAHILMNVSRGAVIPTTTVLKGLESKKILGACIDVLEEEKNIKQFLKHEYPLQQLLQHNVILTPHIAGYTHDAIEKMCQELEAQISQLPM
ncbi:MAG: NAD(P)-dependent oxidoreductase [Chitinophagaceae bacterium]